MADGTSYTYYAAKDKDVNGKEVTAAGWYQDGDGTTAKKTNADVIQAGSVVNGKTIFGAAGSTIEAKTIDEVKEAIKAADAGKTVTIGDIAEGNRPSFAIPPEKVTACPSAIPTSKPLSGMVTF